MQLDGETKIYGIMGKPVSHSLSPAMHNAAFQAQGLNKVYVAFEGRMSRALWMASGPLASRVPV